MDWKKGLLTSTEVWTGVGLVTVGVFVQAMGLHDIFARALTPFGIGLILSEVLTKAAKVARERVKIRIRRDDK